jgi:hypothetical protein
MPITPGLTKDKSGADRSQRLNARRQRIVVIRDDPARLPFEAALSSSVRSRFMTLRWDDNIPCHLRYTRGVFGGFNERYLEETLNLAGLMREGGYRKGPSRTRRRMR